MIANRTMESSYLHGNLVRSPDVCDLLDVMWRRGEVPWRRERRTRMACVLPSKLPEDIGCNSSLRICTIHLCLCASTQGWGDKAIPIVDVKKVVRYYIMRLSRLLNLLPVPSSIAMWQIDAINFVWCQIATGILVSSLSKGSQIG